MLKNIIERGFTGLVYPVNSKAKRILGKTVFASMSDIRGSVDLAIIAVPALIVPRVLEESGKRRLRAAIIISAGFGEIGKRGDALKKQVINVAQRYHITLLGPNCLGIINTQIKLNASWGAINPQEGNVAFLSQSGAIASPIMELLHQSGIGLSYFISLGNKIDIDENDLVTFLKNDSQTSLIIAYLESFKNGQRLIKVAQSSKKPIIILKAGLTKLGAQAAQSHTASLATPQKISMGTMDQANIISAKNLHEFINLTKIFSQSLQTKKQNGPGIAIITNAGGPGVLAADALAQTDNLSPTKLSLNTQRQLIRILPAIASLNNPIDIIGDADAHRYQEAIRIITRDPNVNTMVVILTQQAGTETEKIAEVLVKANRSSHKMIVANFMGGNHLDRARKILKKNNLPNFNFPEEAIGALGKLYQWQTRKKKMSAEQQPSASQNRTRSLVNKAIISRAIGEGRRQLNEIEAFQLLNNYQIKTPPLVMIKTTAGAKAEAGKIGYPLYLKIVSPHILHKTDVGGVAKITSPHQLEKAMKLMTAKVQQKMPSTLISGFTLEKAIRGKTEIILGAKTDPSFGHVIMIGAGGIYTEVLKDIVFRAIPINRYDAQQMIKKLKIYPILKGARGDGGINLKIIEQYLLSTSQLIIDLPQISQLDFNPIICDSQSATVVDAKIIVSQ